MPYIKLESSDGMICAVDLRIAKCFGLIRTVMQICKIPEDQNSVVPLARVNGEMLVKLLSWAEHHVDDPVATDDDEFLVGDNKPIDDDEVLVGDNNDISAWDANFLKVDQNTLFEMIRAANFLNIKGLLEAASKTMANMMEWMEE
ncbi:hypothetical protein KR018_008319 [Drosophila ironensis]|nr:hypothetical protein KR018_008319 [Drosophila ironensis]